MGFLDYIFIVVVLFDINFGLRVIYCQLNYDISILDKV